MPKITNPLYREFLDKGIIKILSYDQLKAALDNVTGINGQYVKEGRAFLITLYYTGARPCEVLNLTAKGILHQDTYITMELQAAKHGLNRTIYIPDHYAAIKELWDYATRQYPDMYLFYHYRSNSTKTVKKKNGTTKAYAVISDKARYHVGRWFPGLTPYFMRHSRFSQLSEAGLTPEELRQIKGAKTLGSVLPYLHLSSRTARKIAKSIR